MLRNKDMNPKDFVANYELNSYRYSDFWKGREYEHVAEVTLLTFLLKKYVPDVNKREIVDLGGAYGRLAPLYGSTAKQVVLADYSSNELLEGQNRIVLSPYKEKVKFVALNAYRLPFALNSIDLLLSVRVMHHLKDLPLFFTELGKTLVPGGIAIIEFANKNHLLALMRHLVRLDVVPYKRLPVLRVNHQNNTSQGMKEGQVAIMYNFSPDFVRHTAVQAGLEVEGLYACSFWRIPLLKKIIPTGWLNRLEALMQQIAPHWLITPSVFIVLKKPGEFIESSILLGERLRCPTCCTLLHAEKSALVCSNGHRFEQAKKGIIDLRDPRPEQVDF